jgi:O-antigen/teichoic acid export membrane protein
MTLARKTTFGIAWNTLANSSTQLANLLVFVLLARQLPLDEFGLVIFALLVTNFFLIYVKEGVADFLIQRPDWEHGLVSSAFWISTGGGVVLTLLCAFVIAPICGLFYGDTIVLYIQVLSPTLFLGAISTVSFAKARREFNFRLTAGRNVINGVLTAMVALGLALFELGAWSLIISRLVGAFGAALLICLAEPVWPRLKLSIQDAKKIARYCHPIFSSRSIGFFALKAADVFLIVLLGPAPLAIYRVGTRIWEAITTLLVHPIMTVAVSTFARVAPDRLGATFTRMTTILVAICLPIYVGAAAIGGTLTVVVFGRDWHESGLVMTILCLGAAPQLIRALLPAALKSLNSTGPFFRFVMVDASTSIVWSAITAGFGPVALAIGMFIAPHFAVGLNRRALEDELGVRLNVLIAAVAPFIVSSVIMFAGVVGFAALVSDALAPIAELALSVLLGIILYFGSLRVVARGPSLNLVEEFAPMVPTRLQGLLETARWAFGGGSRD